MTVHLSLVLCTKIIKHIKGLNIRPETLKLLKESKHKTPKDISVSQDILKWTLAVQIIIVRIDNWDCMQLKSFFTVKETLNNVKTYFTG